MLAAYCLDIRFVWVNWASVPLNLLLLVAFSTENIPLKVAIYNLNSFLIYYEDSKYDWFLPAVVHPTVCDACQRENFTGFRYRCQKCHSFQMCQDCFWRGRVSSSHTIEHEVKEYTSYVRHICFSTQLLDNHFILKFSLIITLHGYFTLNPMRT